MPLTEGTLRLDTRDLKNASASIDVDLTKLSLDPDTIPEGAELGGAPDALALQWLELGSDVAPERRRDETKDKTCNKRIHVCFLPSKH